MAGTITNPPVSVAFLGGGGRVARRNVEGEHVGKHWAIHRRFEEKPSPRPSHLWTVTHRPSGQAAHKSAPNRKAALELAEALSFLADDEELEVLQVVLAPDLHELKTALSTKGSGAAWEKAIDEWFTKKGGRKRAKRRARARLKAKPKAKSKKRPKKSKKKGKGRSKKRKPQENPIKGMPGGSVSGCIELIGKTRPAVDDPGAYCASIADRIEPGWRKRNQAAGGLFRYRDHTIEVSPHGGKWWATVWAGVGDDIAEVAEAEAATPAVALQVAKQSVDIRLGAQRSANIGEPHWDIRRTENAIREFWNSIDYDIETFLREPRKTRKWRDLTEHLTETVYGHEGSDHDLEQAMEHARNRVFRGWGPMDVDALLEARYGNPADDDQLGLFGEKQTEVEGFALVSQKGDPVGDVRPPTGSQGELIPRGKPSREAMEKIRERELAERAARRRKPNPTQVLKRRLTR